MTPAGRLSHRPPTLECDLDWASLSVRDFGNYCWASSRKIQEIGLIYIGAVCNTAYS
jgi:hypothetical protein